MRPASLSLLLALVLAPLSAIAGPTITQLRVTLITGDDAMRGNSDAYIDLWVRGRAEPIGLGGTTAGLTRSPFENCLPSHSTLTRIKNIDPVDLADITNVGVHFYLPWSIIGHSTFLFNHPDEWHMDGFIVTALTASGEEFTVYNNPGLNHRFVRLNLYTDDNWRIDDFKSPRLNLTGDTSTQVNEFRVSVRTHNDDLRAGSRAFCRVSLKNGWTFEHPLTAPPVRFPDHTAIQQTFRLPRLVDPDDIDSVALRYEGAQLHGVTDEWNVQGFSVEARRGLTLVQYYIGSTPHLWNVLAEQYASPIEFNKSRSETVHLSPYATTIPTDARLTVALRTGSDDFRGGSNAYLRVLLNDGGFVEKRLNTTGEHWSSNTGLTKFVDLPAWLQLRHINDWGVRFEADRRELMGDDQWTMTSLLINYDSSLVESPGPVFGTGRNPHHFVGSYLWIPDIRRTMAPLVEEEVYTAVTEIAMEIPAFEEAPYIIETPIVFEEWNELIWKNPDVWGDILKTNEDARFNTYAFGLLPGEDPILEIERHSPDPDTGGKRFLIRYARLLGVDDVNFRLLHAANLRNWDPVPARDIASTTVIPDPVFHLEWVELIITGPTVAGPRNMFRIEAHEADPAPTGGGLTPGDPPIHDPVITPPEASTDSSLLQLTPLPAPSDFVSFIIFP